MFAPPSRRATLGLNPADLLAAAPPGVPPPSTSAAEPLSREAIRAVQSRLHQLGFYTGRIDGIWGPGMQGALQRFQQGRGLQRHGVRELLQRTARRVADRGAVPRVRRSRAALWPP